MRLIHSIWKKKCKRWKNLKWTTAVKQIQNFYTQTNIIRGWFFFFSVFSLYFDVYVAFLVCSIIFFKYFFVFINSWGLYLDNIFCYMIQLAFVSITWCLWGVYTIYITICYKQNIWIVLPQNITIIMLTTKYTSTSYSCRITGTQMDATEYTTKTSNMKYQIPCTHYQFRWTESSTTASASSWWI